MGWGIPMWLLRWSILLRHGYLFPHIFKSSYPHDQTMTECNNIWFEARNRHLCTGCMKNTHDWLRKSHQRYDWLMLDTLKNKIKCRHANYVLTMGVIRSCQDDNHYCFIITENNKYQVPQLSKWHVIGVTFLTVQLSGCQQLRAEKLHCSPTRLCYKKVPYKMTLHIDWIDVAITLIALWTHKRHPIACPYGQAMGCLLWVFQRKLCCHISTQYLLHCKIRC